MLYLLIIKKSMKKTIYLTSILLLTAASFFISCKKTTSSTNPPTTNSTNSNYSLSFSVTGDPLGSFNGMLVSSKVQNTISGITPYIDTTVYAMFYDSAKVFSAFNNFIKLPFDSATSVYCRGTKLTHTYKSYYYASGGSLAVSPANWTVNGNNFIPSFIYSCPIPCPIYHGSGLPTSINRAQNLTVPIIGASGYDKIIVTIFTGGLRGTSVAASNTASSVTFLKDSLALLSPTSSGRIIIDLLKFDAQTYSSKNFLFETEYVHYKDTVLIQ
jgi:hypothetical protein